jgi:glycosyltransferase involved in cell wall biosynthesis
MVQVMERTVVRAASDIVVNSRWLGDALGREYPSARVEWLPNGIDTEALPADVGEPYPGLSVAHLGTIYGERDLTPVLDALKDFLQKNPAARHDGSKMRIAGSIEGPRASELRRAIQERALESQVEVLGLIPRPEALRILARSRLCVVLAQGQVIEVPGKLYESIAMGVPTAILAPRDSASASEATRVGAVFIEQNDRAALAGLLQRAFDGGLTVPSDARAKIDYRGMASELDGLLRA